MRELTVVKTLVCPSKAKSPPRALIMWPVSWEGFPEPNPWPPGHHRPLLCTCVCPALKNHWQTVWFSIQLWVLGEHLLKEWIQFHFGLSKEEIQGVNLWLHKVPSGITRKTGERRHLAVEAFLFSLEEEIEWDGRGEKGVSRKVLNSSCSLYHSGFHRPKSSPTTGQDCGRCWKYIEEQDGQDPWPYTVVLCPTLFSYNLVSFKAYFSRFK